jgi:hypothetical protein
MAKVTVCDLCNLEGKLIKTNRFFKVRGHSELRLDVCEHHNKEVKKCSMMEYIKLTFKVRGLTPSDSDIKSMYGHSVKL